MRKNIRLFMAGCSLALTACCSTRHSGKSLDGAVSHDISTVPWSVVGEWRCTHPAWKHTLTISQDGKFYFGRKDAGHWTLGDLQGHLILVLAWNRWPAETAIMVSPDEFRGKVSGGELMMHRIESPPKE